MRRITFLACEVINLAAVEEQLTGRPFGSPLEDSRAAHAFLPSAGARRFAELPAFASAYLAALEDVYLSPGPPVAPAPPSPALSNSPSPSSRGATPAAAAIVAEVATTSPPQEGPGRAESEADETAVKDSVMVDAE